MIFTAFVSTADAKSPCTLECNSSVCEIILPNSVVFATYEKDFTYSMSSEKGAIVEVQVNAKEQKAEIESLVELCSLNSVK